MAGQPRPGRDDHRVHAQRARTRLVEDRLDPDWRPHTPAQNQAILEQVDLTGPFWSLSGP